MNRLLLVTFKSRESDFLYLLRSICKCLFRRQFTYKINNSNDKNQLHSHIFYQWFLPSMLTNSFFHMVKNHIEIVHHIRKQMMARTDIQYSGGERRHNMSWCTFWSFTIALLCSQSFTYISRYTNVGTFLGESLFLYSFSWSYIYSVGESKFTLKILTYDLTYNAIKSSQHSYTQIPKGKSFGKIVCCLLSIVYCR